MELKAVLKDINNKIESIRDAVDRICRDIPIGLYLYYYDTICDAINKLDYEINSLIEAIEDNE